MATALDTLEKQENVQLVFGLFQTDSIYVELASDSDPDGKCIDSFHMTWARHPDLAKNGFVTKLDISGQNLKFIGLYPRIMDAFLTMENDYVPMTSVLEHLSTLGRRHDLCKTSTTIDQQS